MADLQTEQVIQIALDLGFSTAGVTPAVPISEAIDTYREWLNAGFDAEMAYLAQHQSAKSDPRTLLPSAKSIIAVTLNYYQPQPENLKIARYAIGRDYHKVIKQKLDRLANELSNLHPGSEHRTCVDSSPIFDRSYAHLAGLGWFGKNTMLIDSKRGSWFFIGLLLTSIKFEPTSPSPGGCGTCRKCIDACPTGAIVQLDGKWQVDSRTCISYQTIENKGDISVETDGWLFGCDVCQEVCPFNQPRESQPLRAQISTEREFIERRWPDAEKLANMNQEEWDDTCAGTPLRRAKFQGFQRNYKASIKS